MIARVLVVYQGDDGQPLWMYDHGEAVPHTGDPEQMALVAVDTLVQHVDKARAAVVDQARVEIKNIPDNWPPPPPQ